MPRSPAPLAPLAPLLLLTLGGWTLGACTRDAGGDYPSLARRPAEGIGFAEPATPPAPPLVANPALDATITTMRARLGAIASGFARDAAAAERAARVAGARTVGSEAWLSAQSALASLDDWRAQVSALASEADARASGRAAALQPDYPALATASEAIEAEGDRQTATIRRIQALTPSA